VQRLGNAGRRRCLGVLSWDRKDEVKNLINLNLFVLLLRISTKYLQLNLLTIFSTCLNRGTPLYKLWVQNHIYFELSKNHGIKLKLTWESWE
jgi:hypothetical protein